MSIIRFKPKAEYYDKFLWDVTENGKDRKAVGHFVLKTDDKIVVMMLRGTDSFEQNAQDGVVNWLDERRSLLQEFDPVNRHTMPMTGRPRRIICLELSK
jgi:hypothetical protein